MTTTNEVSVADAMGDKEKKLSEKYLVGPLNQAERKLVLFLTTAERAAALIAAARAKLNGWKDNDFDESKEN